MSQIHDPHAGTDGAELLEGRSPGLSAAAVHERAAGTSEAQARNQAAAIIDALDPSPQNYGR